MIPQITFGAGLASLGQSTHFQATKALLTGGESLRFSRIVQEISPNGGALAILSQSLRTQSESLAHLTRGLRLTGALARTPTFYTSAIGHLLLSKETAVAALSELTTDIQRPVFLLPLNPFILTDKLLKVHYCP